MSNDNGIIRSFKLWAKISMMIIDGTRDATIVADALQVILDKPTRSWCEKDGVIYFSVTSDGTTGDDWIKRLESKGFQVADDVKQMLRSSHFKPTSGMTTEVAILKNLLLGSNDRITKKILIEANKYKLSKPNAELICLISEKFTGKEIKAMGLDFIVVMHEPINGPEGNPHFLDMGYFGYSRNRCLIGASYAVPGRNWRGGAVGFAFAVSEYFPGPAIEEVN